MIADIAAFPWYVGLAKGWLYNDCFLANTQSHDRLRRDVADRSTDTPAAALLRNSISPEKFAERDGASVFLWL